MSQSILVLNAGSSSIKFALFTIGADGQMTEASRGQIEGIGTAPHFLAPHFLAKNAAGDVLVDQSWPQNAEQTHETLLDGLLDWIETHPGGESLAAIGHRVVHGGSAHDKPARVTPDLLAALAHLTPLAPLHEPHNLAPILAIAASRPELPQVVCFDTAFHHAMPTVATRFALPREFEADGVRRYGFHGLSYEFIACELRQRAPNLAAGRVIAAHLGNGASLCAMLNGRSVDTTMGFTALDGLMMGTRCGSIDPGVLLYLQQQRGMTVQQVEDLLYRRSGLLGVSGIGSDMRVLLESPDKRAREAIELFVFSIARQAGALASTLGGLDGFVFTAGIGEHAAAIRAAVCQRLAWLGIRLDPISNQRPAGVISAPDSQVAVWVISTDEEAMIARHTIEILGLL